jgi:hypothetical protein
MENLKTNFNRNELILQAKIITLQEVKVLQDTGDAAINLQLEYPFGNRTCRVFATAYKETAIALSQLKPGDTIEVSGAFYVDTYQDKSKNFINTPKVRINSFILKND